tara:strand:+ start:395 stop:583 length:189 start_codon:yes stop_codon:yes gene_type:complete
MSQSSIIVVGANVSLKPYLAAAQEANDFEAQLEKMGFEVAEEKPARKIGYLAALERYNEQSK